VLVAIAEARGITVAQVALAWLIGRPGVTSVVIGARTDAQLQDNLKAANLVLTAEERAQLDAVSVTAWAPFILATPVLEALSFASVQRLRCGPSSERSDGESRSEAVLAWCQ
jgi:diketogulonate reductase-like aldo/keto reductase